MKQIYLIFLLGVFFSAANVNAQITVAGALGGKNGTYASLTGNGVNPGTGGGVFAALNSVAQTGANITVTITGNTAENGANSLNAGAWNSITISPGGGAARTVSGSVNGNMINFNGADNVTINGLNTGGNSLTISNTNTNANISTIHFINDASNNTITNCTILGSSTSALTNAGGTILFSTGTTTGNDNNTISYCNIGPAGANLPSKAIMSLGSTNNNLRRNSGNTISHNNIYDFFLATGSTSGIYIYNGNDDWTIDNNRLYQSGTRSFSAADFRYAGISLNTVTRPGKFTVSSNIIGFANAAGTSTTTINGTGGPGRQNEIRGIDAIAVNTLAATTINGNLISGFHQTTSRRETPLVNSCFIGIALGTSTAGGSFQCGTTSGNTIGSLDASSSIIIDGYTVTAGTSPVMGILDLSSNGNNISNNNIGTITINAAGGGPGDALGFTGIYISTTTGVTATTENNTIGGATSSSGITDNHTGNYVNYGIYIGSANPQANNNIIRNITTNSSYTGYMILSAIFTSGSTGSGSVSNNIVHSLSNNSNTANNSIYAISTSFNSTAANNIVQGNLVHSLNISSTNKSCQLVGIRGTSNNTTNGANYRNNMVRLGIDADGNSITGGYAMYGIFEVTGSNNFDYNSVYIGGTGVVTSYATYSFISNVASYTRSYRNNIFYNARNDVNNLYYSNFAIAISGLTNLTCDYNDLYVSGNGGTIGFSTVNRLTFTDWQTATGRDVNSVSVNPQFINPTGTASTVNLHLQNYSPLNAMGTPITGITTDYDADTRNATTPDIGADEIVGVSNMVTVTATAGVLGPTTYPNLRNALRAINNGTHNGNVTVSINGDTYEPAQAVLNRSGAGSANYTSVNIQPGIDAASVNGYIANPVIKLNNAANVTINGDNPNTGGTNRNLTIYSDNFVLWVGGSSGNAANNVQVKNCIITGDADYANTIISDATTLGNAGYFTNITFDNNLVQRAYVGIYSNAATSAGNGNGLIFSKNDLNASGANAISYGGLYLQGVDGATVSGNNIGNIETSTTQNNYGVWAASGTTNSTFENNNIFGIKNTGTSGYGAYGLKISTTLANANITIKNNMISGITGDGDSYASFGAVYSPVGIYAFGNNQGGINIHFNSIRLNGGNTINYAGAYSFGIALDNNTSASISNNIIQNEVGRAGATGVGSVCIAAQTNAAQFITLDYNDLYCNATGSGTKNLGKIAAT
ncbi:MAG: hypothetical protein JSR97_06570, partial [Verrucomicrobia bacterium]|nr:hypothetical protein [Verrucomicrobiota bacterium]